MALTDIDTAKDAQQTYLPLLLAVFTLIDGSILRLASNPLATSEGGVQYGGEDYYGRVLSYQLGPIQGNYEGGIDIIPRVTVVIADADKAIWTNYQDAIGFTGANLDLTFVFYDIANGTFSSDELLKFRGLCDPAKAEEDRLTVTAVNKLNLQRRYLPIVPFQRRCPWINPATVAQRAQAGNEDSIYWECGEDRDLITAPPCEYTKATCTQLDRRGGLEYSAPAGSTSREYTSGEWIQVKNAPSQIKYGDPIPMVYGKAWVDCSVTNVIGDGNSTRGEAVICLGRINVLEAVIVNDIFLQGATDMDSNPLPGVVEPHLCYQVLNRGDRDGAVNPGIPWNSTGDPYGSMAAIVWTVPRRAAESSSVPRVRALVQGVSVRVYADPSTYTLTYSDNPAWVLLDLLIWSGMQYDDIDLASFVDAAPFCDDLITYTNQFGASASHKRYSASLVLSQRATAADVIRKFRQGFGAILLPNTSTGKLKLVVEGSLAQQQSGSYVYDFDRVLRVNGKSSLRITPADSISTPNKISFQFIDSENDWALDSLSLIDPDALGLTGQEVATGFDASGINTLDQAKRIARRTLAKGNQGNSRGDHSGTDIYEFDHSFGAVRVQAGDICKLSDAHHALSNVPIRILSVQPLSDYQAAHFVAARHDDAWYADTFGQDGDPSPGAKFRDRLARPAFPWSPKQIAGGSGDPLVSQTQFTFGLSESHDIGTDGAPIARLLATGLHPVNIFSLSSAPLVGRQGTTASSGGSLVGSGQNYYLAVAGIDSDGLLTALSVTCTITVTNVGSANTVTIPILHWPSGITGYRLYAGNTPHRLTLQSSSGSTPTSITLTALKDWDAGPPDSEFDRMRAKVKLVYHAGVFGAGVSAVATNTISIPASGITVNQFAGYTLQVVAKDGGAALPVQNFLVSANNAGGDFTVSPNPSGVVSVGDVVAMLSKPTVGSDGGGNYVSDSAWMNAVSVGGAGFAVDGEIGHLLRITNGPGIGQVKRIISNTATKLYIEGDWTVTPTSASRYLIEESDWRVIQDSDSLNNSDEAAILTVQAAISNYRRQVLLIKIYTLDGGKNESFDAFTPERVIYVFGTEPGHRVVTADTDQVIGDRFILCDTTAGDIDVNLLPASDFLGLSLSVKKISADANVVHVIPAGAETIDGQPSVDLPAQWDDLLIGAVS